MKVYQNWTQDELDDQINQTSYFEGDLKVIFGRYLMDSTQVRTAHPPSSFAYGPGIRETLDVFAPVGAKSLPVMVFIHGGAWTIGSKDYFEGPAPRFLERDVIYIAIDFDNIPPNTMAGMVLQCRKALQWIVQHAEEFGADPDRIFLSGHSSGGHLANVLLTTDWAPFGLPANVIKGGVILSGWTDLIPISLSSRQSYLNLTTSDIESFSPIRHIDAVQCPVIVSWGIKESPYMKGQSAAWANALKDKGRLYQSLSIESCDHYQMPMHLANNESPLMAAIDGLLGL